MGEDARSSAALLRAAGAVLLDAVPETKRIESAVRDRLEYATATG
jgi:hypothetical protein